MCGSVGIGTQKKIIFHRVATSLILNIRQSFDLACKMALLVSVINYAWSGKPFLNNNLHYSSNTFTWVMESL